MKNYKIKKRKKFISSYYIFLALAISLLFVSYGYAFFSDTLNINIRANILDNISTGDKEYGNSTYSWVQTGQWGNDPYIYQVELHITNLDDTFYSDKPIEISFDVPDHFNLEASTNNLNVWQAEEITLEGHTVTILFSQWSSWLENGQNLDLYFQLPFDQEVTMEITNVKFAGKYAIYTP